MPFSSCFGGVVWITKHGYMVRSKTPTAMENEVLTKVLCHNLCCLIQEQETLGIVPVFWKNDDVVTCNELAAPATKL